MHKLFLFLLLAPVLSGQSLSYNNAAPGGAGSNGRMTYNCGGNFCSDGTNFTYNAAIHGLSLVGPLTVNSFFVTSSGPTSNTTTSGTLAAAATTMTVVSTTGYPTAGTLLVGPNNFSGEVMSYTGTTSTTFTGLTRSLYGTTAPTTQATAATVYLFELIVADSTSATMAMGKLWKGATIFYPTALSLSNGTPSANGVYFDGTIFSDFSFSIGNIGILSDYASTAGLSFTSAGSSIHRLDSSGYVGLKSQSQVTAAATIAPTAPTFHMTGATPVATITPPGVACTTGTFMCQISIIPDSAFTTVATGNIAIASTAVVSRVMYLTYDPTVSKWFPSY